jgi:hypothetical protein
MTSLVLEIPRHLSIVTFQLLRSSHPESKNGTRTLSQREMATEASKEAHNVIFDFVG